VITLPRLAQAEARLGVRSHTLVFSNWFGCRFTYDLSRLCRTRVAKAVVPFLVLPWALARFDVFHFFADRGLLPPLRRGHGFWRLELALMRLLGKRVFVYTYGGDVRTREITEGLGRYNCCLHCPAPGRMCICDDARGRRNLAAIRRGATALLAMGDMAEYTRGSRNDLFFWPVDTDEIGYVGARDTNEPPVRVVHAPNHRHFKGTDYLVAAVARLREEGLPLELDLVERVPNAEALARYARADIVAEQFLIGFHGYTALEAMALGKPVICFIRKPEYVAAPGECPIVSADPDQLLAALRALVVDAPGRRRLGLQGRAYVERHYSLAAFAERLRLLYGEHGVRLPTARAAAEP
jgi:glycosyltransferase involved in cell wall biosynthesis